MQKRNDSFVPPLEGDKQPEGHEIAAKELYIQADPTSIPLHSNEILSFVRKLIILKKMADSLDKIENGDDGNNDHSDDDDNEHNITDLEELCKMFGICTEKDQCLYLGIHCNSNK